MEIPGFFPTPCQHPEYIFPWQGSHWQGDLSQAHLWRGEVWGHLFAVPSASATRGTNNHPALGSSHSITNYSFITSMGREGKIVCVQH